MALARPGPQAATSGFLEWWLGELRTLLPRRWRETAQRRFGVVLMLERPYLRVYERKGRRLSMLGSIVLPDPGAVGVAAAPAVRHCVHRSRSRFQLSTAAPTGNSQIAAASELRVYAVVGAAPVSWASTAPRAWNVDG